MHYSKLLNSFVVASMLAFSSATHAAVVQEFDFGSLLTSGGAAPNNFAASPFAHLTATSYGASDTEATGYGDGDWTFLLTLNNTSFSSFGGGAFLGSINFDFDPLNLENGKDGLPVSTFIASNVVDNTFGVTSVESINEHGQSSLTGIDFGTGFGQGANDRLSGSDWVSWSITNLPASNGVYPMLNNMFVHVQAIGDTGYSAKYTPVMTPVPEPETYAMLLAGLGLIGFSARRKNKSI